jgi:hypothetical protein
MTALRRSGQLGLWALVAAGSVALVVPVIADGGGPQRSPISPRGNDALRFAHARHASEPCERCHEAVARSTSADERHAPAEATCRACHARNTRRDDGPAERLRGDARCAQCHAGYGGGGVPVRVAQPQAQLRFAHRLHAVRGVSCAQCHPVRGGEPALPEMERCLACHREERATTRCASCHLTGKDGRLITRLGYNVLKPQSVQAGAAHTPAFARQHAQLARANKRYCESCHRSEDCLRCHAGSRKPARLHSGDYVTHHALDARRDQPRCASCHRAQSFCLSCHQRLGVARTSARGGFKPSTGIAFHAPGFVSLRGGPGHHQHAARRNIRSCTSCHEESTCVRCHGTRQTGRGGFSPHGPGFGRSLKCRALAQRNLRACLKCHAPGDRQLRCVE